MNIRLKQLLVVVSLIIVLLVVGTITTLQSEKVFEKRIVEEFSEIINLKTSSLENFFEETVSIGLFFQKLEVMNEYVSLSGKNRTTQEDARFKKAEREINELLHTFQEVNWGKYHHMFLIDETEHIVLSPNHGEFVQGSPSSHFGEDTSDNVWAHDALMEGIVKVSDYSSWSESSHVHQMMFVPIVDGEGVTRVVLGFELQIPYELQIVAEGLTLSDSAKLSLFTNDGRSIAYDSTEDTRINNSYGIQEAVETGSFSGLTKNEEGEDILGVYVKNDTYPWILGLEMDKKEAFEVINSVENIAKVGGVSLIILISLLTYLFSKKLITQIEELVVVSKSLAKGNLLVRSRNKSKDEFGDLSKSFNSMADSILEARSGLERRVEERTREINKTQKLSDKQKLAILNILEDVQEEKKITDKLKTRLEIATRAGSLGIFEWHLQEDTMEANDYTYKIFNMSKKAKGGVSKQWITKVYKEDKEKAEKFMKDVMSGKEEFSNVIRFVWGDESIHYVKTIGKVIKNDKGEPVSLVGVNIDITHEKEVDKAKTEFVSLASHQLRTPLSAVSWYAEMLLEGDAGKLNKKQADYLQEIYQGNSRMVSLVNSLLNVSRLELGTFAVEPKKINPIDILNLELEGVKKRAQDKKIKIDLNIDKTIDVVDTDPNLLSIMFQNLLTNAIKYSPENTSMNVLFKKVSKGEKVNNKILKEDGFLYEVEDHGYGIPSNQQDKIFSKLFRADNVMEHDTDGTGLGLYILKSIISNVGGDVWFKSKIDKGTVFSIIIPQTMKSRVGNKAIEKSRY